MPLAPSYESVYTTLAHNRRTTRTTRPAPRNESCVACVCGTPGSLNTRTPSFLQVSRTWDACYLRLVSKDTQWSRWRCPTGLFITPDRRVERKAEEEEKVGWRSSSSLLLIPLSNHRRRQVLFCPQWSLLADLDIGSPSLHLPLPMFCPQCPQLTRLLGASSAIACFTLPSSIILPLHTSSPSIH